MPPALRFALPVALAAALALPLLLAPGCGSGDDGGNNNDGSGSGTCITSPTHPTEVECLYTGFAIEELANGLDMPVKMALAPDGRLFFNELSGDIHIIDTSGDLVGSPFATVSVLTGDERGLLGIAISPDFATNGHVFVMACVAGSPDRQQIIRYTAVGDMGTSPTVIVDDLPIDNLHNAGALCFQSDGTLLVSVGDANDSDNAQDDASLAGRVLRYNADGSIPSDNPDPTSPEFARGLRNSFGMTIHGPTGGIFATENGPDADDELNYIQAGKNYEWETLPPGTPGSDIGLNLRRWPEVIAPTGLTFHDGTQFGSAFADSLFLCSYTDEHLIWMPMSGAFFTDIDDEVTFLAFNPDGSDHKPLDVLQASDGSLYLSTFTSVWRIYRE